MSYLLADNQVSNNNRALTAYRILIPFILTQSSHYTTYSGFINGIIPIINDFMKRTGDSAVIQLGRRIRRLRSAKGWTQQTLGDLAEVNYKFIGEIERGRQNPSLKILVKIADALEVDLSTLFEFKHELMSRKEIESELRHIINNVTEEDLRRVLLIIHALHPTESS